jgi:hypothetical protein
LTPTKRHHFSFLASGPQFELDLPEFFDGPPELDSPLFNGIGGRAFSVLPAGRDEGVDGGHELLGTLEDSDGRPVEFYWRTDPPALWLLRWQLASGALYTHLRGEDGSDMAETTVKSVSVVEDPETGAPFLLIDDPMVFAASAAPGYQETAQYFSAERGVGWGVTFQRPGFMPAGRRATAPRAHTGGLALVRAGLGHGMEVTVWAGREQKTADEVVTIVSESLSQR